MTRSHTALIALACSLLVCPPAGAQDVWTKPLALPTTCYTKGDAKGAAFDADLKKAKSDLEATAKKQNDINTALSKTLNEQDMGTKQQKMMAFLSKDPVAGRQFLMEMNQGGARQTELRAKLEEQKKLVNDEHEKVSAEYKAERAAVDGIMREFPEETTPNPPKLRAASLKYNAAYEKLCAKWFTSATSPYAIYLGHFKKFLLENQIPTIDDILKGEKLAYDVYGIPSAGWKSTAEMDARRDYLGAVGWQFNERFKEEPWPIR